MKSCARFTQSITVLLDDSVRLVGTVKHHGHLADDVSRISKKFGPFMRAQNSLELRHSLVKLQDETPRGLAKDR